jgi:hypothetical protein
VAGNSGLARVVRLAIVVALLYFAFTEGLPWLRQQFGKGEKPSAAAGRDSGEDGTVCVQVASRASEALGAEIPRFARPPVDLDAWGQARIRVEDRVYEAERQCGCGLESCRQASQALSELRSLISQLDSGFRGSDMPPNPARQQGRVDELLNEARNLARQGR